jgi:hypothetical protein
VCLFFSSTAAAEGTLLNLDYLNKSKITLQGWMLAQRFPFFFSSASLAVERRMAAQIPRCPFAN